MDICDIGSAKIAYKIFGTGSKTIIIDTCLGSCSAEWWHIAELFSKKFKVLVFDRPGYGQSSTSNLTRTPKNISSEINKLLEKLKITKNIILIGHSQGGLNLIQFAIDYITKIDGLVLLDPATPFDDEFKKQLTDYEYKNSGVDKTTSFKFGKLITSLKLGFIFRFLLKKSPPFYYFKFSNKAEKYLLKSLTQISTYQTALDEYSLSHHKENTKSIENAIVKSSLKNIPIKLITHSSDFYVKELEKFGGLNKETAQKIEDIWQKIMKRYLKLSKNSNSIIAKSSGHYIHLTDQKLLNKIICNFI